jgi:hypothetical protein
LAIVWECSRTFNVRPEKVMILMARTKVQVTADKGWWAALNSPIAILLLSVCVIGGIGKLYTDHQNAVQDQTARRSTMSNLLVEYRQRLSALEALDSQLDGALGAGPGITRTSKVSEVERKSFEKLSEKIGLLEQDVIKGVGTYTASAPAYDRVNMQAIASQIEDAAGIPNLQAGGIQLLGLLNTESSVLWLFVRAYLPMFEQFYVSRYMMVVNRQLPLVQGDVLSRKQEAILGIPQLKPGELNKLMKENDIRYAELQNKLSAAANEK